MTEYANCKGEKGTITQTLGGVALFNGNLVWLAELKEVKPSVKVADATPMQAEFGVWNLTNTGSSDYLSEVAKNVRLGYSLPHRRSLEDLMVVYKISVKLAGKDVWRAQGEPITEAASPYVAVCKAVLLLQYGESFNVPKELLC